jgi:hypothetical protein
MYLGVPPGATIWCIENLVPETEPLVICEKPVCLPGELDVMSQYRGRRIFVNDHWVVLPAIEELRRQLRKARRHLGELRFIGVDIFEKRGIPGAHSVPFTDVGTVLIEMGWHAINLLRHGLFAEASLGRGISWCARYHDAPRSVETFRAFAGMLTNIPHRYASERRVMIAVAVGKGMHADRKRFIFVFEKGAVTYDHSSVRIVIYNQQGASQVVLDNYRNPFVLVFNALATGSEDAFQTLDSALQTERILVNMVRSGDCRSLPDYAPGTTPLGQWPADGLLAVSRIREIRSWIERTGFLEAPAVRQAVHEFLSRPNGLSTARYS